MRESRPPRAFATVDRLYVANLHSAAIYVMSGRQDDATRTSLVPDTLGSSLRCNQGSACLQPVSTQRPSTIFSGESKESVREGRFDPTPRWWFRNLYCGSIND